MVRRVWAAWLGGTGARLLLRAGVALVVRLVGGPPLTLVAAVARVVAHRWYSWFCGERMVRFCWGGCACGQVGVGIRIDDATRTVLTGMQARRLLESDNDITIRLPPLFRDVSLQVFGKCVRREIAIGADLLEIGPTEGNDVGVRRQKTITRKRLHTVGGLPPQ